MDLDLFTRGLVLGVRVGRTASEPDENGVAVEVVKSKIVDLYNPDCGAGQLETSDLTLELPREGQHIIARVSVRAFSGFVRRGVAGDARVFYTLQSWREDNPATTPNGKPNTAAAVAAVADAAPAKAK